MEGFSNFAMELTVNSVLATGGLIGLGLAAAVEAPLAGCIWFTTSALMAVESVFDYKAGNKSLLGTATDVP